MDAAPKLSVVIGTFNRLDLLQRCLKSIRVTAPAGTVTHVTDAGSTDGTVEWLRANASPRLVPHLIGKKIGQARALNDVFRQLATPYTAWLSDDNILVNGGLAVACAILDENPGFGMVGLKVKDVQGPFVDADYIGGVSSAGILNVNQGLLRTPVLHAVGGFSEEFVDYGIDPDLTAKVLFAGERIVFTKAVLIHHYRGWAPPDDTKGQALLKEKHERYYRMYNERYLQRAPASPAWDRKLRFWEQHQGRIAASPALCGPRSLCGMNRRDWMNVLKGRYIQIWDCWANRHHLYHLLQALENDPMAQPGITPAVRLNNQP